MARVNETITAPKPLLPIGSTAVRRDVFEGRIWTEAPTRVLRADERSVTTAIWPGVRTLASKDFIASKSGRDAAAARVGSLDGLAAGTFELGDWTWRWTSFVTDVVDGRWFTVIRIYDQAGPLVCWYVNFERPPSWRPAGWDTMDLALDLVVEPDGRWSWKDEDEYAHSRRLGLVTEAEHAAVDRAREEAVDQVEQRLGVFGQDPGAGWLPDPAWPLPALA
jgi:predicted RNA-binding protein associated with RNAse of E/G family